MLVVLGVNSTAQVLSATKLIRLAQTYSEEQGRDQARINDVLEERLANLEQQVDAVSAAATDAVVLQSQSNMGGGGGGGGCGGPAESRGDHLGPSSSSGLCEINTAGLSEWMTGVDKQLEDLQRLVSARLPIPTEEGRSGNNAYETESSRQQAAVQQAVRDECSRVEERLRTLEATLMAETVNNNGRRLRKKSSNNAEDSSPIRATERDRGRRLERCVKIAREGLSRSRSASPNPTRTPPMSPPPPPPMPKATDAHNAAGLNSDAMLHAVVEEGTAVARKASELAEEALKVGKEAAERSERTGELTDTGALRARVCLCVWSILAVVSFVWVVVLRRMIPHDIAPQGQPRNLLIQLGFFTISPSFRDSNNVVHRQQVGFVLKDGAPSLDPVSHRMGPLEIYSIQPSWLLFSMGRSLAHQLGLTL